MMRAPAHPSYPSRHGFTLVEMLTAMMVLGVILFLFVKIIDVASRSSVSGLRRAENHSQARVILGLLERDVQGMVARPDLAAFVDAGGEPACAFFTSFQAPGGDRRVSLVSYELSPAGARGQLVRRDYAYQFDGTGPDFRSTDRLPKLPEAQSQSLCDNVLAFKVQFLSRSGQISESYQYDHDALDAATNTRAILVSLVSLDAAGIALTELTGKLDSLRASFSKSATNKTFSDVWTTQLNAPGFLDALPADVRPNVRVFKREFSLPSAAVR